MTGNQQNNETNSETKEQVIDKAFVGVDGQVYTAEDYIKTKNQSNTWASKRKELDGSNNAEAGKQYKDLNEFDIIEPPYNSAILAQLLEAEENHYRACVCKATDTVLGDYFLQKVNEDVTEKQAEKEKDEIDGFIEDCNEIDGFEGVLFKCALDFESVGWGAFEVVRSLDKKIARINHVPAQKVKALKGWKGFVEQHGSGENTYYLPFGHKVVSRTRKNLDGNLAPYNPKKDGKIENAKWNLRDKRDLKSGKKALRGSANELVFIPQPHPKSVYYGIPTIIPALGSLFANINIRDYFLQFFEHNTVPQYAVVVKGAKLTEEVKQSIMQYFSQEVKGHAHKTLVIPLEGGAGGEVDVEFHALADNTKEGSFQETRQNNRNAILVAHGVSPAVVGVTENASLGSGKGNAQASNYKNRIIDPLQRRWEHLLRKLFVKGLGITDIKLKFDSYDIEDRDQLRRNLLFYLDQGCLSINQVIEKARLGKPIKGGDEPFVKVGTDKIVLVKHLKEYANQILNGANLSDPDGRQGKTPNPNPQPTSSEDNTN